MIGGGDSVSCGGYRSGCASAQLPSLTSRTPRPATWIIIERTKHAVDILSGPGPALPHANIFVIAHVGCVQYTLF